MRRVAQSIRNRRDSRHFAARDCGITPVAARDSPPQLQGTEEIVRAAGNAQTGSFDQSRINKYLEKWDDRFDLFHEKFPFYQQSKFKQVEPSGINRLAQELSRGNNAALFDHTTDDPPPALSPAHAARVVIAEQAFAVGGGKSDTGNTTKCRWCQAPPFCCAATRCLRRCG